MTDLYIVTGASRGLGAALAAQLRARLATEVLTLARRDADVAADLGTAGGIAAACAAIARRVQGQAFGKAVLINNAGVVEPVGVLGDLDAEALARNVSVNLTAPLQLTRAFVAERFAVRVRRVINISSGAGRRPIVGWGPYCATKAALDMATRVLVEEATARGEPIEAVSLAPGVIDTDMQAVVRDAGEERFPEVGRFRQMKVEGVLRPAEDVAGDILALEESGALVKEPVADLRSIR